LRPAISRYFLKLLIDFLVNLYNMVVCFKLRFNII
jgi:hypothetical protein